MFLKFDSQEERKKYGGSCFIELQICKLPLGTKMGHTNIMRGYNHWEIDSLYICDKDQALFYQIYKDIIGYGLRPNMSEGYFDTWGVTYFDLIRVENIEDNLKKFKPDEYEILLKWFEEVKQYNGFYILGV